MKNYEKQLIDVVNDFEMDYGVAAVLDELFGEMSVGEIVLEMYNAGIIPNDVMEKFVNA